MFEHNERLLQNLISAFEDSFHMANLGSCKHCTF